LIKSERGVGLIEVMIAIALLGIIAIAFLSGLATASKALFIADERATAESLARSQMEYVKNQDYSIGGTYDIIDLASYPSYAINLAAEPLPDPNDPDNDLVGIQKITVVVSHSRPDKEVEVIILEDYKVDR